MHIADPYANMKCLHIIFGGGNIKVSKFSFTNTVQLAEFSTQGFHVGETTPETAVFGFSACCTFNCFFNFV